MSTSHRKKGSPSEISREDIMDAMERVNRMFKSGQQSEQNISRKPSHDIPSVTSIHARNKKSVAASQEYQDSVKYPLYHYIPLLGRANSESRFSSSISR